MSKIGNLIGENELLEQIDEYVTRHLRDLPAAPRFIDWETLTVESHYTLYTLRSPQGVLKRKWAPDWEVTIVAVTPLDVMTQDQDGFPHTWSRHSYGVTWGLRYCQ